jgi:hypothetical protein
LAPKRASARKPGCLTKKGRFVPVGSPVQCEVIECIVAASRWLSVLAGDMPRLRATAAAAFPGTVTTGILKQADEQSLTALVSLRQAMDASGIVAADCDAWGLVAAPRTPGRKRIAESISRFAEQGAWSVSPHVIPHCSLHSLSGMLSQALQLHGPNIGAGGVAGAEAEALWAALALLEGERLPGVWVVLTGWERDTNCEGGACQAAVVGLRPAAGQPLSYLQFRLTPEESQLPKFSLASFGEAISQGSRGCWQVGGAEVVLEPAGGMRRAA